MGDDKAKEYKVVIDQEEAENSHYGHNQQTVVAPSGIKLSPTARAILPIASYCFASILMTVTNKYVLSGYEFNMNFLLLTIQNLVTVFLLVVFKFFNLIKFRDFDKDEARKWLPVAISLVGMIYTGSKALQYLRIPIYTIFKNLTIILIAYGEVLWFGGRVTHLMLISFGLMVLSSVIAGWADISETLSEIVQLDTTIAGYFWMATNCITSAAFVLYMRKRIKLTNFKDFDTVFYNNILSIPFLIIPSFIFEDWSAENLAINFPSDIRQQVVMAMIFSGASAFAMSYASAWCVRTTSSTTYSMVGALNKLPIAASGILFFGDPATFGNVTAIIVGFIAGIVYSVAKTSPNSTPQNNKEIIPMSSSSQSNIDAVKDHGKP
ncbi:GDP-mannose transporter into the lumen of the Golgi [Rhizopus azygosporus]|uniref:GDP-mannose transporter n=1 Tax=Rhizopus azygosporus TaxID=86630 RepID=A0A367JYE3_RHIAZ|nr:GDP-mannose transporter into the lumen of the Golgi [Rhizopus azygosporus]CEG64723.1 Putative GDP-mannose transporter [Rhizopus microsporus]